MTSEELYTYIHNLITKIRKKYKNIDVCEFGEDKICINKQNYRKPNEGCCGGCQYHAKEKGCLIPEINLTCMSVYCECVTKLSKDDKNKLKLIETLLKILEIEPRTTYKEQIAMLDSFGNMNTSEKPLKDIYNLFTIIKNQK